LGAQGNTTVDFGAFPGSSHTTTTVTGQAGILAGSSCEAWVRAEASADHTADEHIMETINVRAGSITPGVGFVIHAWNTSQLNEPLLPGGGGRGQLEDGSPRIGGIGTRISGVWNVSWVWN
jgi:hypothetical protein